ncbi:cation:proton antiporter [Microbacterium sp. LRZ72]|uniref:cation:proton antiporter n=1 Tax=Microbacterium sp. LRZ72 TaxID=2942481 RepID=UPI0029AE1939|nr:cation:proton antiporter [Microbacterium sp. LRZ72]MDX2376691.1 cation:proton antiporter [Microbacterium sp. LRZ72]
MPLSDSAFLLVAAIAVLAPLLARGVSRVVRVPIVVFELVLGILVGPAVLGWVTPDRLIEWFADLGLAVLFFMAGNEIDARVLRGRTGARASIGWVISLGAGILAGFLLAPGPAAVVIGIALCSTALGTLLPILRDDQLLDTPFGRSLMAIGAVGEFGPLVAISLFMSGRSIGPATIVLLAFVAVAAGALLLAMRMPHGSLHRVVTATLHTSGQFAVRTIMLILGALVALSLFLDLDMLLGAFVAGLIWQLIMRNAPEGDRHQVESKIEAVGFGVFVPVFFIYTGITFDLDALVTDPSVAVLVPVFLVALLVIRGLPSLLAAPLGASPRERAAVAFLGATGLPVIVAVTGIGVSEEILTTGMASALVGAGMLSVLLYPLIGMALRGIHDEGRHLPPVQEDAA